METSREIPTYPTIKLFLQKILKFQNIFVYKVKYQNKLTNKFKLSIKIQNKLNLYFKIKINFKLLTVLTSSY